MKYELLAETGKEDFNNLVQEYLNDGWILYGGPSVEVKMDGGYTCFY